MKTEIVATYKILLYLQWNEPISKILKTEDVKTILVRLFLWYALCMPIKLIF